MARAPWVTDAIHLAGERFVEQCLRNDGSLFTPARAIWTGPTIGDFYERFVVNEQVSGGDFLERLERQLEGASEPTIQLAAEVLFFYSLTSDDTGPDFKSHTVDTILGWMEAPVFVPDELSGAYESGLAEIGLAKTQKWQQIRFLLEFAQAWKQLIHGEQKRLLADPWEFREFVKGVPKHSASVQVEALLYLVSPDEFESVVSPRHKQMIRDAFASLPGVAEADNVDRALQAVRRTLEKSYGDHFTFYRPGIRPIWEDDEGDWRPFVDWAAKLFRSEGFDAEERDDKLVVAERMAAAREALLRGDASWPALVKTALATKPNNLTNWRDHEPFYRWCQEAPEEAALALRALWEEPSAKPAVDRFLELIANGQIEAEGGRISVASVLLMGADSARFPPFRPEPVRLACRLLGHEVSFGGSERYAAFLELLDELRVRLLLRGVELRDRLDAQGLAWWITSAEPPAEWSEEERRAFLAYRDGSVEPVEASRAWLIRGANNHGVNMLPQWFEERFVSISSRPTATTSTLRARPGTRPGTTRIGRQRFDARSNGLTESDPPRAWLCEPCRRASGRVCARF
jgi:hypothetical protein